MLSDKLSPSHPLFDGHRKLLCTDVLREDDETACVSTLLSPEGECWNTIDATDWGMSVTQCLENDRDAAERVFRRPLSEETQDILVSAWNRKRLAGYAVYLALQETVLYRNALILFPNLADWGVHVGGLNNVSEYLFIRYSSSPSGLKSLPVSTLILVDECDSECAELARERLRGCISPKLIQVSYHNEDIVYTDRDIWSAP